MNYYLLLLIPAGIGFFVGLWCLVAKLISLLAWSRLAVEFGVTDVPAGPQFTLSKARLGVANYQNVIQAGVSAEGLSLTMSLLFRIGHPPLLIPWSALGPFRAEKVLWTTFYATDISCNGTSIRLVFTGAELIKAAGPWIQRQGEDDPTPAK